MQNHRYDVTGMATDSGYAAMPGWDDYDDDWMSLGQGSAGRAPGTGLGGPGGGVGGPGHTR